MKELEFLEIIKNTLSKNNCIGDDCAYLKDLGIVISQDSLVEDIHFSMKFSTPYLLAYKAIIVNLSDIFASGAIAKYFTVSLSLPQNIDCSFIKEFYRACEDLSVKYDFEIVGGDITGSDKIFISVCAIGLTERRNIASRSYAKDGDYVITTGIHGSSAAGLWLLKNDITGYENIKNLHLKPLIDNKFSYEVAIKIKNEYAMMDTSDGLADALYKIAQASGVSIVIDFNKIPYDPKISEIAKLAKIDYKDWVLFGGEDYQLVACVSKEDLELLSSPYTIIGNVETVKSDYVVCVNYANNYLKINDLEKTFNHFNN